MLDARPTVVPNRYLIAQGDDVWTDTALLERARRVANALNDAGHGVFDVIDGTTGLTVHSADDIL